MRETYRIAAHFAQQIEILRLVRLRNCPTLNRAVLMHGRTLQEKMLTIEKEPFVGVEFELPQAEGLHHLIEIPPLNRPHRHDELVEVRIFHAPPQARVINLQSTLH